MDKSAGNKTRNNHHHSRTATSPEANDPDASLGEYCELERTGVAVGLDAANRIFTALPVVPVP